MTGHNTGRRNLAIMWFSNFFIAGSMTMVLPFLSLFIESFGNYSNEYVQHWAGITFSVTFVMAFLISPLIGRIGDKYGRKKIMVFMAFGMAFSIYLLGFADSVWDVLALRLLMGCFSGFIPLSQAFISTQTHKKEAGRVLGTLQTGSITGTLIGPLLGGVLADQFGYSATFQSTSFFIFISGLLVLMVTEFRLESASDGQKEYSRKDVIQHILKNPVLLNVLLISALVQIAHFSIQPILSLYVADLHGMENIAFFSGLIFSAAGIGNLLMARRWGKIADQIGYLKILVLLMFLSALVYFPGAFVTSVWQLLLLRLALGFTLGGIIPVRIAYIRQEAPIRIQGEVLGYNTSLRFLGNIIGPLLGGFLSGTFGFSSVFFVTSALLLAGGLILVVSMRRNPQFAEN